MRKNTGFTLVEILISAIILMVLSSIGISSYQQITHQGRRATAIAVLAENQLKLEMYKAKNGSYSSDLSQVGGITKDDYYNYSIGVAANNYTLTATAISGTSQQNDSEGSVACTTLTLNGPGSGPGMKTPSVCWN
ncbi:type IV pilin protein [Candidatus Nitrosacidococcus tergens]|uniref:Pilus assembly protein n=1 Tax=Candidatus Nitrosacidococcus tergens TaxID=553981 RepID=A0A7G1Q8C9_9GAMM|nr:type IV pilin protein [Candidatus Nitrosacidococcus tergens]CAB1275142.1 Pilus assembly protein [Candidatus Nitrosacidococcus tergens]